MLFESEFTVSHQSNGWWVYYTVGNNKPEGPFDSEREAYQNLDDIWYQGEVKDWPPRMKKVLRFCSPERSA